MRRGGGRCAICSIARIVRGSRDFDIGWRRFSERLGGKLSSAAEAEPEFAGLTARLKSCPSRSNRIVNRRIWLFLQMFTHVSPVPFVSEQNPLKDAKMKLACSALVRCCVLKRTDAT